MNIAFSSLNIKMAIKGYSYKINISTYYVIKGKSGAVMVTHYYGGGVSKMTYF